MGGSSTKLPPLSDLDMRIVLSYTLKEEHLKKFLMRFRDVDLNFIGAWGVQDMYTLISEPRLSMRSTIIDALFFMGDSGGEGALSFPDFLVLMASFCVLSREEVLQLLFIILDRDRNGRVSKQELLDFFSYVPSGAGENRAPVFPVNNKNSLDRFRQGKWQHLQFDGFCQLCEHFPYISYPAYHTQELYRQALLGMKFWERIQLERAKLTVAWKPRWVLLPGTGGKEQVEVRIPGRCTMQEMIDFSRRTTRVEDRKRVASRNVGNEKKSEFTMDRDDQVARCPIFNMIRNPRCMYHIPREVYASSRNSRKQMEAARKMLSTSDVTGADSAAGGGGHGHPKGVLVRRNTAEDVEDLDLGKFGDEEDEDEDDESYSGSEGSYETGSSAPRQ